MDATTHIPLAKSLRGAHPAIAATRDAARHASRRDDGRLVIRTGGLAAHMTVTRACLNEALLLLRTVLREAERRGYAVVAGEADAYSRSRPSIQLEMRGHRREISIKELTDRVPMSTEDVAAWEKRRWLWDPSRQAPTHKSAPNGLLQIAFSPSWGGKQSTWSAGKRAGLDRKLPAFFAELEARVIAADERAGQKRLREVEQARERAARQELERLEMIQHERVGRLRQEIADWRQARETREYIAALRARLATLAGADRERVSEWCSWAEQHAAHTDPTLDPSARIQGLLADGCH